MGIAKSRRALLLGGQAPAADNRPPWTDENFTDLCVRCGDCIDACPERVLAVGDGGFPQVVFRGEGCTFCEECVSACPEPVFDLSIGPFRWKAVIEGHCLAFNGIHCQSCQDACEPEAITFRPRLRQPPEPVVAEDTCTGCFACAAVCPQDAITLASPATQQEPDHARTRV